MPQERENDSKIQLGLGFYEVIDSASADTETQGTNRNLEIKLRTLTPTACIGSSLKLEIEMTNTGPDVVTIDKVDVWSSFSFSYYLPDPEGAGMGGNWNSGCSHCRGNYIVIEPGATYWEAHEISLSSFEFFKKADKYTLTTGIDSVSSNEVIFELYDCGNTKEEAK